MISSCDKVTGINTVICCLPLYWKWRLNFLLLKVYKHRCSRFPIHVWFCVLCVHTLQVGGLHVNPPSLTGGHAPLLSKTDSTGRDLVFYSHFLWDLLQIAIPDCFYILISFSIHGDFPFVSWNILAFPLLSFPIWAISSLSSQGVASPMASIWSLNVNCL